MARHAFKKVPGVALVLFHVQILLLESALVVSVTNSWDFEALESGKVQSAPIAEPILSRLEAKLLEQESIQKEKQQRIHKLKNYIKELEKYLNNQPAPDTDLDGSTDAPWESHHQRADNLALITKEHIPQSCEHLKKLPHKGSGHYSIDPDGLNGNHDPIVVFCDLENGITVIEHSNPKVPIEQCDQHGCTSKNLKYKASIGQVQSLVDQSGDCSQVISMPPGNTHGWWEDLQGNKEPITPESQVITITNAHQLPVQKVYANHSKSGHNMLVHHEVGPLLCRGKRDAGRRMEALPTEGNGTKIDARGADLNKTKEVPVNATKELPPLPEFDSCYSLYQAGIREPGYHWIKTAGDVFRLVFCDMRFILMDAPEGRMAQFPVGPRAAGGPIHFHAVRKYPFNYIEKKVPFDEFYTSDPNFDLKIGWFIAPVAGFYRFYFQTMHSGATVARGTEVYLVRNFNAINGAVTSTLPWAVGITQAVLQLEAQDKVYMRIFHGGMYSNFHGLTFFTGSLLDPA